MHRKLGTLLLWYGAFLVLAGIVGFELTREQSTSALFNGSVFGSLIMILGVLHRQGRMWTSPASMSATAVFAFTFLWRSALQWYYTINGDTSRMTIAVLLSIMAAVSVYVFYVLFRNYRH